MYRHKAICFLVISKPTKAYIAYQGQYIWRTKATFDLCKQVKMQLFLYNGVFFIEILIMHINDALLLNYLTYGTKNQYRN